MATSRSSCGEAAGARRRLIATDGVFSMDGYLAPLDEICELAERYDAMVMVDDSHAVGFIGAHGPRHPRAARRHRPGRHRHRHARQGPRRGERRLHERRKEIVELLRQRSRPYLFSNSVAPPIVGRLARGARPARRESTTCGRGCARTRAGSARQMTERRLRHPAGRAPDRPGDARRRGPRRPHGRAMLLNKGVYVIGFSYPVVPMGKARIRVQMSAAHSREDLGDRGRGLR